MDADGSKKVSAQEFQVWLKKTGWDLPIETVVAEIKEVDKDNDGHLDQLGENSVLPPIASRCAFYSVFGIVRTLLSCVSLI